ncbi:hypothetical protein Leryth_020897 [Lithospermum erythrorhizon]|nr:hypothetical protein Leryth_020897 [Lithospermum erythrorhizon]
MVMQNPISFSLRCRRIRQQMGLFPFVLCTSLESYMDNSNGRRNTCRDSREEVNVRICLLVEDEKIEQFCIVLMGEMIHRDFCRRDDQELKFHKLISWRLIWTKEKNNNDKQNSMGQYVAFSKTINEDGVDIPSSATIYGWKDIYPLSRANSEKKLKEKKSRHDSNPNFNMALSTPESKIKLKMSVTEKCMNKR